MTRSNPLRSVICAALCLLGVGNANAELFDRGGGLIYDDALNVTWLQDANYAQTSGFDADGYMTWAGANSWAAGLNYYDSVRNVTYSDWRLPGENFNFASCISGSAGACAASGNEMVYMYYFNLGGVFDAQTGNQTSVLGSVTLNNIPNRSWSSTGAGEDQAFSFAFANGTVYIQVTHDLDLNAAWAVRDGDVASPIPEPETYAMLIAGLALLGFHARRRRPRRSFAA